MTGGLHTRTERSVHNSQPVTPTSLTSDPSTTGKKTAPLCKHLTTDVVGTYTLVPRGLGYGDPLHQLFLVLLLHTTDEELQKSCEDTIPLDRSNIRFYFPLTRHDSVRDEGGRIWLLQDYYTPEKPDFWVKEDTRWFVLLSTVGSRRVLGGEESDKNPLTIHLTRSI